MQRWGQYLAEVPQALLRLIASHQRVSMPRQCPPDMRLARLRAAICRSAAAREAFFGLHAEERAAVQSLLVAPPGAARAQIIADLGPIRSLAALRADRAPQSLAERLLLMGWLLPRPAGPQHPATYLLAPELRAWLPRPLALPASPAPPTTPDLPLALRAATAIILAAARAPLPLRQDGRPTAVALRRLRPLLAPAAPEVADALVSWLLPLLADRDLLAAHGAAAALGPAAGRFLAQSHPGRLELLRAAWVGATRPDDWLRQLRVCTRGIAWPALRRRLLAWADALPAAQLVDPATSYASLSGSLGPLADSYTHRLRPAGRSPWQPRRAAAVWQAAVDGPLAWLGVVAHTTDATGAPRIYQCSAATTVSTSPPPRCARHPLSATERGTGGEVETADAVIVPWRYGDPGVLYVPHVADDADLLSLQPFAFPVAADVEATTYRLSRASVAAAVSRGQGVSQLRALLERRGGPIPDSWGALLAPTDGLQLRQRAVLLGESPELLAVLSRQPGVRRQIESRPAPGVALVRPGREAALERALERAGAAVDREAGVESREAGVGSREAEVGQPATDVLPPDRPTAPNDADDIVRAVPAGALPDHDMRAALELIRQTIPRRRALHLHYQPVDGPASMRWVQPLALERHGGHWLLHAYCMERQAERCFRVDRIRQITSAGLRPPTPHDRRRPARAPRRPPPAPRTGFFGPPPTPPPGSPLVRVWLE